MGSGNGMLQVIIGMLQVIIVEPLSDAYSYTIMPVSRQQLLSIHPISENLMLSQRTLLFPSPRF
jgi:hypothetical protein